MPYQMKFRITSEFGDVSRVHPHPHTGIDLGMPTGTPLTSVANGVVERVVDHGPVMLGKGVMIRMADGKLAVYGHLSHVTVKPGQHITAGQQIGLSGNTGHSTGPHLHFGVKDGDHYIDPSNYLPLLDPTLHHHHPIQVYTGGIDHLKEISKDPKGYLDTISDIIDSVTTWLI